MFRSLFSDNVNLLHAVDAETRFSAAHTVTSTILKGPYTLSSWYGFHNFGPETIHTDGALHTSAFKPLL